MAESDGLLNLKLNDDRNFGVGADDSELVLSDVEDPLELEEAVKYMKKV